MVKTYLWMAFFLGLNWGGFIALLLRTLRRSSAKTTHPKVNDLHPQPTG
jgi:hypothetical protein